MSSLTLKNVFAGSLWGIVSKIASALIQFFTIPWLIGYFGKADYGLIALAYSLNAYLRLMDLGMNTGAIRYFSMWAEKKETIKIIKVSQSSIIFYGVIGILNTLVFIVLGFNSAAIFHLQPRQAEIFQWLMYILAASTIFNWLSYVVNQLLNSFNEIAWVNKITIISSVLNLLSALIAIGFKLTLPQYFILYVLSFMVVIPLNIGRLKKTNIPIVSLLLPRWNFSAFKEVLTYSLALFAMGIFQFTATDLRPVLLGSFASEGVGVVTEYRILHTIALLVLAIGGVFLQVLLPASAKSYATGDKEKINQIIYNGTKYISLFLSLIIFGLVINVDELLVLYVGKEYKHLSIWLIGWLITLFYMHNAPVSSLILSVGKTRPLVWSSAIGCVLSVIVVIFLAPELNVGAAIIGYLIYIIIQLSFSYFYYIPIVLKLNGRKIFFSSFLPSIIIGIVSSAMIMLLSTQIHIESKFLTIIVKSAFFLVLFFMFCVLFIIKPDEIKMLFKKIITK